MAEQKYEFEEEVETPPEGDGSSPDAASTAKAKEDQIAEILRQNAQATTSVAKLALVPGVAELLEAHSRGRKAKIVYEDEAPADPKATVPADPEIDFDTLGPKEIVKHSTMGAAAVVDKAIKGFKEELKEMLSPLHSYVQTSQAKDVERQVTEAQKKYPDLLQYREQITALNNKNPDLSVEELYVIAKSRAGHKLVTDRRTETERPTTGAPKVPMKRKGPLPPGNKGFNSLLDGALAKLDFSAVGAPGDDSEEE